jgi:hypothetical protein
LAADLAMLESRRKSEDHITQSAGIFERYDVTESLPRFFSRIPAFFSLVREMKILSGIPRVLISEAIPERNGGSILAPESAEAGLISA